MPRLAANCCHLVGGLASGSGFSRGRGVLGGGRERRTPSGVEAMGQVVKSWSFRHGGDGRGLVGWSATGDGERRGLKGLGEKQE